MKMAISCIPVVPSYKHSSKQSQQTVMLAGFVGFILVFLNLVSITCPRNPKSLHQQFLQKSQGWRLSLMRMMM